MAMTTRAAAEQFAAATDALLQGETPGAAVTEPYGPELELVARLRSGAAAGIADPAFVAGLREDLRVRAASLRDTGDAGRETSVVRYTVLDTALGPLAIAYRDGRVVYCSALPNGLSPQGRTVHATQSLIANRQSPPPEAAFARAVAQAVGVRPERDPAPPPALLRGVHDHLAGTRRFIAVDLSWLPSFQRRVLEKTAEIPRGEVRPYGWVAREIGAPGAVRAVGTALGHNPVPFLIPCHRVVRSDGSLGEYSGGGPAMKERVLALEGAPVAELVAGARRGERYRGSRTTHIVCYPSCHAARRIRDENVVPFPSLARALAGGYRPCERCRPA